MFIKRKSANLFRKSVKLSLNSINSGKTEPKKSIFEVTEEKPAPKKQKKAAAADTENKTDDKQ